MSGKHILIVEARFYDDLADELARGAVAEIEAQDGTYERVAVPALAMAALKQRYGAGA